MSTPCWILVSANSFRETYYTVRFTESRTPPSAFSSASVSSFLRWSSPKLRCPARPLVVAVLVGPEGTVGA